jgi:erythrin-vacuolar iron transport family protein
METSISTATAPVMTVRAADARSFLLTRVQPALSGLMDGSLSTLAPIFAVALATHRPLTAFFTGVATPARSWRLPWEERSLPS